MHMYLKNISFCPPLLLYMCIFKTKICSERPHEVRLNSVGNADLFFFWDFEKVSKILFLMILTVVLNGKVTVFLHRQNHKNRT